MVVPHLPPAGVRAGWLYCRLCDKKCDKYEIMLGHLASAKHKGAMATLPPTDEASTVTPRASNPAKVEVICLPRSFV